MGKTLGKVIIVATLLVSSGLLALGVWAGNPFLKNKSLGNSSAEDSSTYSSKAVMIVLDCSGSMADTAETGQSKMFAAKQVLEKVLAQIEPNVQIGLRVYGSSQATVMDPILSCQDSVLLVPPGPHNRVTIINKLREIKPAGATPISFAMRRAVDDLKKVSAEKKSVVLISDGIDTCGYDPCSLADSMKDSGVDVQFNVVGFGVAGDFDAIEQLQCIAKSTEGRFYTAQTAAQLTESVLDGVNYYSVDISGTIREREE